MDLSPSKTPIRVSDHAVLRYLERAMDLNIEVVREHIMALCVAPASFGAVCVRAEGLRFELASGVVTTVTSDHRLPGATSQERSQYKIARDQRKTMASWKLLPPNSPKKSIGSNNGERSSSRSNIDTGHLTPAEAVALSRIASQD